LPLILDKQKSTFAKNALRRASYRWVGRWQAEKESKVGRNQYKCAICTQIFPKKETQMDHVAPVEKITGWEGFDVYIDRLLVYKEGWQRLCKPCHTIKTESENSVRRKNRKKKKC
jgi:5-methylcytosine-specific restriction endonuclease McrA